VLILDGEELVGTNRTAFNVTILVTPHSDIVIPVSCTGGALGHSRRGFAAAGRV
jgi:hypothetical protein